MPKKAKTNKAIKPVKKIAKKPVKNIAPKKASDKKIPEGEPKTVVKAKPSAPPAPLKEVVEGTLLGTVEDYFSHVGVIAVTLQDSLVAGDTVRIKGHTTDIIEKIESLQIEHQSVTSAKAGDGVGIKVKDRCRPGDRVYRI
ncbi:MAG: hypothetical protein AAB091_05390 [Elusimicrobiota bacterium]